MKRISVLLIVILVTFFVLTVMYAQEAARSSGKTKEPSPNTAQESTEPQKAKVTVSQKVIDQQMTAYKGDLKEIVREAENNLKKIDAELKVEENEKATKEHLNAADSLYSDGKYGEAKVEYQAALAAASTPAMKKMIKDKERMASQKADQAERENKQKAAQAPKEAKQEAEKQVSEAIQTVKSDKQEAEKQAVQKEDKVKRNFTVKSAPHKVEKEAPVNTQIVQPKVVVPEKASVKAAGEAQVRAKEAVVEKPAEEAIKPKAAATVKTGEAAGKVQGTVQVPATEDAVSTMYKEAVSLYWDNKYSEAQAKFEQIQGMSPGYARTSYYLGRIKDKLTK